MCVIAQLMCITQQNIHVVLYNKFSHVHKLPQCVIQRDLLTCKIILSLCGICCCENSQGMGSGILNIFAGRKPLSVNSGKVFPSNRREESR